MPVDTPKEEAAKPNGNHRSPEDLLGNVNGASGAARNAWLAFLGVTVYLLVTLAGVRHQDLLLNTPTTLPFINVKVPLNSFFVVGPLVFVLVHMGLLVQHEMLMRKLEDFQAALKRADPVGHRRLPIRGELHSYFFSQAIAGKPRGPAMDTVLHLMLVLTFIVLPAYVLLSFQIGFLPYHSAPVTWWHRGCLVADLGFLVFVSRYVWDVVRRFRSNAVRWLCAVERSTKRFLLRWLPERRQPRRSFLLPHDLNRTLRLSAAVLRRLSPIKAYLWLMVFMSVFVATLPDSWLDRSLSWLGPRVPCCSPEDTDTRRAFLPTALLFERRVDRTTGQPIGWPSWSRNLIVTDKDLVDDKKHGRISLRGRDLRYGTFDRSDLSGTDFYGAKLLKASFFAGKLGGTSFRSADLTDTNLKRANLEAANLKRAKLQGAALELANLRDATLFESVLVGADLRRARLHGADLRRARLHGANLVEAHLHGANLFLASLQGADLERASLHGANLSLANLQGADLLGAHLHGANLSLAGLEGADLPFARLHGTDLRLARLHGASLLRASLQGADVRVVIGGFVTQFNVARLLGVDLRVVRQLGSNLRLPNPESGQFGLRARGWSLRPPESPGIVGHFLELADLSGFSVGVPSPSEIKEVHAAKRNMRELSEAMSKAKIPGFQRLAAAYQRVERRLRGLLQNSARAEWKRGEERAAWLRLITDHSKPDRDALAAYLAQLACQDNTEKGYMAQRLIGRVLETTPLIFLKEFQDCPAMKAIPAALRLQLERAAKADRAARLKKCEAEQKKLAAIAKAKGKPDATIKPGAKPPARKPDLCAKWRPVSGSQSR